MSKLMEVAKNGAEQVADGFTKPDDDWLALVITTSENGEHHVREITVTDDKIHTAATLATVCYMQNAVEAVFVSSAYATDNNGVAEVVVLCYVSQDDTESVMAEILRDGVNPPSLGEWKHMDMQSGLLVDALKMGCSVI